MKLHSLVVTLLIACVSLAIGKRYIDMRFAQQGKDITRIFKTYGVEFYDAIQTEAEQTS